MDIRKTLDRVNELRKLASNTDSKKEDLKYRMEIKELLRQVEDFMDKAIDQFPDEIQLHIKVDKKVNYDTSDFKSWLYNWLEENEYDIDDLDMDNELKEYIAENFYAEDWIDFDDCDWEIAND